MFQLFMRFIQVLGMIRWRRVVIQQMIIVYEAVEIENLWVVEARLLIVVHRIQVVRVMTLWERDNAVT